MAEPTDTAALEAAIARALAPALQQFEDRLGARLNAVEARLTGVALGTQQLISNLDERLATVADRLAGLETVVAGTNAQLTHLHVEFAEIKGRLGRLSTEMTRSRTIETDRYVALAARVEALEASLNPPR